MKYIVDFYIWVTMRFVMGFIFLWAFVDKLFGLGFATKTADAWIRGGSPTTGFLKFGVTGPFSGLFHALAGNVFVDWLFMLGLLGIGLSLILGIGLRIAGWCGAVMVTLMWLALLPPKNNPIIDEHIVYFIIFLHFAKVGSEAGEYYGLAGWWRKKVSKK